MLSSKVRRSLLGAAALAAVACGAAVSGALASPAPTVVQQVLTTTSTVESVDQTARQVLLRLQDGTLITVYAGPQVRNLAKLHAGDTVRTTVQRAIAVQMRKPGGALPPPSVEIAKFRAAPGQMPAGGAYALVRDHVKIDSVDAASGLVAFTRSDGTTGSVTVHNPAILDFARQLKPGDLVDVDYLEAIVINAE